MFKSLGLFEPHPCPDSDCQRVRCIFTHRPAATVKPAATPRKTSDVSASKRRDAAATDAASPAKRLKATSTTEAPEASGTRPISSAINAAVTKSSVAPSAQARVEPATPGRPPYAVAGPSSGAPRMPLDLRNSPQPYADRQKGLTTLFTQYAKLYAKLPTGPSHLAHDHAFAEESAVSASSPNLRAYKTAIHHAAVSISRRPVPDTSAHPSIGTIKASRAAHETVQRDAASRLTRASIEKYCLPLDEFAVWRYPDPRDPALLESRGEAPNAEGESHNCSRCAVPFVVSSARLEERFGECRYHFGRVAPERVEGKRKWIYSCCRKERGEAGCEDGVHVFSEKEDDVALGRRVAWKSSARLAEERASTGGGGAGLGMLGVEVVGMDCEMISTTAGSSLARVTIVDQDGGVLLDELVRQTVPILDLSTRFSGIKPGDLDKAVMELSSVRAAASLFIGPDTIVVGHGLENDLRALRLLHDKVVDTAVVFPHDKGPPFRRALPDIVKEKLGYFIQDRTADLGHSSAVDAQCTLDVLRWKVREDP